MQIHDVLKALKQADPTIQVYFDFAGCVPTTVDSWRGIYAEPALGWQPSGYSSYTGNSAKIPNCADLIAEIEKAIDGRTYTGWKGGEFSYSENDTLHIDNPGDCTQTEISHIVADRYSVMIYTKHVDVMIYTKHVDD